jgi:hypothetical protein
LQSGEVAKELCNSATLQLCHCGAERYFFAAACAAASLRSFSSLFDIGGL